MNVMTTRGGGNDPRNWYLDVEKVSEMDPSTREVVKQLEQKGVITQDRFSPRYKVPRAAYRSLMDITFEQGNET
jgi:hypothetical protein